MNSPQIRLDNSAKFSADTTSGGGNIQLKTPLFILRRGSSITTNALGSQIKGGNINIDSQNGFIIAVPGENSDISANSANFQGGNVIINNIAGLFGIEQTTAPSNSTNDITATGATPELSGNIKINTSNVNQTLGLVKLPTDVADARTLLRNGCEALAEGKKNSFTLTGRGGIPPNPYDPLSGEVLWTDTRLPNITSHQRPKKTPAKPHPQANVTSILPATGWVFTGSGFVTLISNAHGANSLTSTTTTCSQQ